MSSVLDTFVDTISSVSVPTMSMEMFSSSMPFNQPNGLHNFIKEIRDSKSKEDERSRVDKELGNIRKKFFSSSNLSSYQKKKYVWKMCYIYMLGYEVDFGFMEFISLLSSTKFQEKSVGYMAVALFLKPGDEMMTLVINSIRNDVVGRLSFGQTLALSAVANIGGADLAEALAADVQKLVLMPLETQNYYSPAATSQQGANANLNYEADFRTRSSLSKKSILCLLRLIRANSDVISPTDWVDRFAKLLQEQDLGIITSLLSLLVTLAANPDNIDAMAPLFGSVLSIFSRLAMGRGCGPSYLYYKTSSPWVQVKCLKFFQNFGIPVEKQQSEALYESLIYILTHTEHSDSINKTNGDYSILYEAINLIISYGPDAPEKLRAPAFTFIGRFVSTNEPNVRYIGLDLMNNVLKCEGPDEVKVYKNNVLESLKDTDESVRKRALENIFSLTDEENAHDVIDELLVILTTTAESMKEEFVVKIAILTEKYYDGDLSWYVDTMVRMIILSGDFVAEAIWHRVVLIVTNHPEIHDYAANKLFICIDSKAGVSDALLGLAAYLLGEIGVNICEQATTSGELQFLALHHHFSMASPKTQSILLTTYVKFMNLYPEPQAEILEVFEKFSSSLQLELQQRSCEYIMMPTISADTREQVLNVMPPFSAEKENELLSLDVLDKNSGADKNAWSMAGATAAQVDEENEQDQSSPTGNSMGDLLTMDEPDTFSSPMQPVTQSVAQTGGLVTIPEEDADLVHDLFIGSLTAATNERSIIYENASVKISVAYEFRAYAGRLRLVVFNKTNENFSNLRAEVNSTPELIVKIQSPPPELQAGQELVALIAADCFKPFKEPVNVILSFDAGYSEHSYTLRLPILLSSFFDPVPSDRDTYMARWKMLENEVQEIFPTERPLDREFLGFVRNTLFPKLKIGLATDLDTSERTCTGSFSLQTGTTTADGKTVSVGGMLRLEADVNQKRFRVTIRSKHPLVSQAIKDILKEILA